MADYLGSEVAVQTGQRAIVKGAFWTYLGQGVVVLATLLSNVILARLLDKENWGIFSLVISVVSFLSAFSDAGFNYTIQNRLASSADKKPSHMRSVLGALLRYKLILIAVSTLVFFLAAWGGYLSDLFKISGSQYFIAGAAFFLFFNLSGALDSVFIGLRQFKNFSFTSSVFQIIRLVLSVLLVVAGFGVMGAINGYVLALMVAISTQVYLLRDYLSWRGKSTEPLAEQFKYGFSVGIASMAYVIYFYSGAVVIGLLVNPTAVGFYRIATGIAASTIGAVIVINKVMFSFFSSEKDSESSMIHLKRALKYAAIFALPACIGLAASSDVIVGTFFGNQYLPSFAALMVLGYFVFDAVYGGILISYLAAKGQSAILGKVAAVAIPLNLILGLLFVNLFGFVGAAMASVLVGVSALIYLFLLAEKKLNMSFDLSVFKQPFISSFIMLLVLVVIKPYLINPDYLLSVFNVLGLGVYVAVGALAYFVSAYLLGFELHVFIQKLYRLLRS